MDVALTAVACAGLTLAGAGALRAAGRARWRVATTGRLHTRAGGEWVPPRWARAPRRLVAALDAAGVGFAPHAVWHAWVGLAGVVVTTGAVVAGPGAAALAGSILGGGPLAALALFRDRRDRVVEAALPSVLDGVARSLRGGASLLQALQESAVSGAVTSPALADDLGRLAAAATAGAPLDGALAAWAARRPLPGVRLVVASLSLAAATGGAPARALDGVAATLRSRLAVAGEVRALSSQARASGLVIALAPVAFMVLAAAGDRETASFLFRSPLGLACLAAGIALDGMGAVWMHRLTSVDPW